MNIVFRNQYIAKLSQLLIVISTALTLGACQGGGGGGSSDSSGTTGTGASNNPASANNTRPVAKAGVDFSVVESTQVSLDGQNSYDSDGDTFTYFWRQISGPNILLSSDTEPTPSFVAPSGSASLSFELIVNDGYEDSIADTVAITVLPNNGNHPPTASAGQNHIATIASLVTLDGSESNDPDGDSLSYDWVQVSGTTVELSSYSSAVPWFNAPGQADTLVFSLTVSDGLVNSTPAMVSVTISSVVNNQAPIAVAGPNQIVEGNSQVTLNGAGSSDPDNHPLNYQWQQTSGPNVVMSSTTTAGPTFTAPAEGGALIFALTVNDGLLDSAIDHVTVDVNAVVVNHRPVADAGENQEVDGNTLVVLSGDNSDDSDNDSLNYLWVQTGGSSVTLSSTTTANPEFTSPSESSVLYFSLTVNDGKQNSLTDTVVITVTEEVTSHRPIADAGNDQTVEGNSSVALNGANSSDPDGDALSYTWLQIHGDDVALSSTTSANPVFTAPASGGTFSFSLMVSDGQLDSLIDTVTVIVNAVNTIPVANAGVDRYVASNAIVTLRGSNSYDDDGDTLSYRWQQVSGPVAVLNSTQTANPGFSADVDGRLIFSLVVNDGEADSLPDSILVTVGDIPVTNMKVNGTGITWGANYPSGNNDSCIGETIDQQDCYEGRDISHGDDSDGRVGFSYIKIAADGSEVAHDSSEWDCVKDQVTGLIWEVKKGGNTIQGDEGLHDADDTFRWHNTDASSNGGAVGFDNNGYDFCYGYTENDSTSYCNTQAYTARVNLEGYCGYHDWRMPSRKELQTLIDFGQQAPMIDSNYFPAGGAFVWSSTPLARGSDSAWGVYFAYGSSFNLHRANPRRVRLVRSAP